MNNIYANNENTIILRQILNQLKKIKFDKSKLGDSLKSILCIFPNILAVILIKYMLQNNNVIATKIWDILFRILYKKQTFVANNSSLDKFIDNEIRTRPHTDDTLIKLSFTNNVSTIRTLRFFPCNYIKMYNDVMTSAKTKHNTSSEIIANLYSLSYDESKKSFSFSLMEMVPLYPSSDYVHLRTMISNIISVSTILNMYKLQPLLLNGIPGIGKTNVIHFLSDTGLNTIRKIDMTNFMNSEIPLHSILANAFYGVPHTNHTLYIVDELDKYIFHKINTGKKEEKIIKEEMLNSILSLIEYDIKK